MNLFRPFIFLYKIHVRKTGGKHAGLGAGFRLEILPCVRALPRTALVDRRARVATVPTLHMRTVVRMAILLIPLYLQK
jgi:hypothetical protein